MTVRLAILGGSAVSTVQLIDAIAAWPGGVARRPAGLEVVLHGRTPERLEAVAGACQQRAGELEPPVAVHAEPDLARALDGSDAVLNQVRIGGLEARALDESFSRPFGIPGEETLGPGGFACAVRTVGALRPVWASVARYAPGALMVNLTNPAGIVQEAARAEFGLPVVTVCDSPLSLLEGVAQRLGRPPNDVRSRYVGMNHVGWYVPADGELDQLDGLVSGLDPSVPALHEALPTAYMRYYVHPDRMLAAQQDRPTRAAELLRLRSETLSTYQQGKLPEAWDRAAPWYALAVVPLLDAWLNGSDQTLIVGLPNAGRLAWLPPDVIVEGPARVEYPGRIEPQPVTDLPDLPRGLLARHAAFERLTARALAGNPSAADLTRALLANPMVGTLSQARALMTAITRNGPHA